MAGRGLKVGRSVPRVVDPTSPDTEPGRNGAIARAK